MNTRCIALDTETTGLSAKKGDRIIEIGCVEVSSFQFTARKYHTYLDPQMEISPGAVKVHGITSEFLRGKPLFPDIWQEFVEFIRGADIIIHNAQFDVGFLDAELTRIAQPRLLQVAKCKVVDTLHLAREKYPLLSSYRLGSIAEYLGIDHSAHDKNHGAITDATLLSSVYTAMTTSQGALQLQHLDDEPEQQQEVAADTQEEIAAGDLAVLRAGQSDLERHQEYLEDLSKDADGPIVPWETHTFD